MLAKDIYSTITHLLAVLSMATGGPNIAARNAHAKCHDYKCLGGHKSLFNGNLSKDYNIFISSFFITFFDANNILQKVTRLHY